MPALAIAAALCLGGCASVPPLDPAPLPRTQASLAANEAFGGAAGTWPSDSWWRAYGDPQLDALMAEPRLRAVRCINYPTRDMAGFIWNFAVRYPDKVIQFVDLGGEHRDESPFC